MEACQRGASLGAHTHRPPVTLVIPIAAELVIKPFVKKGFKKSDAPMPQLILRSRLPTRVLSSRTGQDRIHAAGQLPARLACGSIAVESGWSCSRRC